MVTFEVIFSLMALIDFYITLHYSSGENLEFLVPQFSQLFQRHKCKST